MPTSKLPRDSQWTRYLPVSAALFFILQLRTLLEGSNLSISGTSASDSGGGFWVDGLVTLDRGLLKHRCKPSRVIGLEAPRGG